jgi:type IV secretion system protein TrbL
LWNRTAFLAERVLGNVFSAGIKVLVLAIIVGIGSSIFGEFHNTIGSEPSVDQALAVMLASLALLGLGIFGPGIATGLVSGGPQLGAGAAVGTALAAGGLAVAGSAAVVGGTRLALRGARAATSLGAAARTAAPHATPGSPTNAPSGAAGSGSSAGNAGPVAAAGASDGPVDQAPAWARRLRRRQRVTHGVAAAAHVVRSSDRGGSGSGPDLGDGEGRT